MDQIPPSCNPSPSLPFPLPPLLSSLYPFPFSLPVPSISLSLLPSFLLPLPFPRIELEVWRSSVILAAFEFGEFQVKNLASDENNFIDVREELY